MSDKKSFTEDLLFLSMLERNNKTISVQKPDIAIKKLKLITTAALELSNRKGFQAMSLRELSKSSGVSLGGMYAYFDSKTTLLNMILSEVISAVQYVLSEPPASIGENPIQHLNWLIESHIRLSEQMLPWFTFSFMEAKNFPDKERRMAIDSEELTERYFRAVCDRAIKEGYFHNNVSPLLPSLIKPLLQDWYVKRSKYQRRKISVESYIQAVQELIMAASLTDEHRQAFDKNART